MLAIVYDESRLDAGDVRCGLRSRGKPSGFKLSLGNDTLIPNGPLAQLVEHHICNVGVAGSNPVRSTHLLLSFCYPAIVRALSSVG